MTEALRSYQSRGKLGCGEIYDSHHQVVLIVGLALEGDELAQCMVLPGIYLVPAAVVNRCGVVKFQPRRPRLRLPAALARKGPLLQDLAKVPHGERPAALAARR